MTFGRKDAFFFSKIYPRSHNSILKTIDNSLRIICNWEHPPIRFRFQLNTLRFIPSNRVTWFTRITDRRPSNTTPLPPAAKVSISSWTKRATFAKVTLGFIRQGAKGGKRESKGECFFLTNNDRYGMGADNLTEKG